MQEQSPAPNNTAASTTASPEHYRAQQVAENIWQLQVPIPFPLKTVNMYALLGRAGWVLVDTSMGTPETREAFKAQLQQLGLHVEDLQAILLTHHHPDHAGLSGELQEQSGAPVYMHPLDIDSLQYIWTNTLSERFGGVSAFFARHGLAPTELWYTRVPAEVMRTIIRVPARAAFIPVEDGESIELADEIYRVYWTPGHSDGQICLLRERDGIFLAADHVLPRITPNIGLYSEEDRPNPLGDYLSSLARVATLPATLALPGHGKPFSSLAERTAEIAAHHEERMQQIVQLLAEQPLHAYGITERLFGSRLTNDEMRRMAVAEVLAHLEYLRFEGRLARTESSEGLLLYTPM